MRKAVALLLLLFLAASSVALSLPAAVEAKTIIVPDDYTTIQEAVASASNGDTIFVKGGRYFGNIIVDKSVQIIGESPATTTVYGTYAGSENSDVFQILAPNVVIANMTVTNEDSYAYVVNIRASGCEIRNSILTGRDRAIQAAYCSNVSIIGNTFSKVDFCILFINISSGAISENIMPDPNSYNIVIEVSSDIVISGNDMTGSGGDFVLRDSNNCTVQNNTLGSGDITLLQSPHCSFLDNTAQNPTARFIIEESPITQLKRNSFSSAFGVFGYTLADFTNDIDTSNTINGKPIYYLMNQDNLEITPETYPDIGYLAVVNSSSIKISNLSLSNNIHGILLAFTTDSEITENNLSENDNGILLAGKSNGNSISMNKLDKNGMGIRVYDSSNNNIFRNEINQSSNAIWLDVAVNNRVVGNNVLNVGEILHMVNATGNTIYHNNFINYRSSFSYLSITGNIWNDGYPGGGNYWGHSGIDEKNGPSQGQLGSDGIIDDVKQGNDVYPLAAPVQFLDSSWKGEPITVEFISNSTLSDLRIDDVAKRISFKATGEEGTVGFSRITLPNSIAQDSWNNEYSITVNGQEVAFTTLTDSMNTYNYMTFQQQIEWLIPLIVIALAVTLTLVLVAVALIILKRKRQKSQ